MTAARFPGSSRFTLRVGATYREKLHDGHLGVCARSFAEAASGIRLPTRLLRQPPLPEPELMPEIQVGQGETESAFGPPGSFLPPSSCQCAYTNPISTCKYSATAAAVINGAA